jgi:hypothetical protein
MRRELASRLPLVDMRIDLGGDEPLQRSTRLLVLGREQHMKPSASIPEVVVIASEAKQSRAATTALRSPGSSHRFAPRDDGLRPVNLSLNDGLSPASNLVARDLRRTSFAIVLIPK